MYLLWMEQHLDVKIPQKNAEEFGFISKKLKPYPQLRLVMSTGIGF